MTVLHPSRRSRLRLVAALLLASALPAALISGTPAQAQLFFSRLPPGQIVTIVRSQGYQSPSYPYYRGDIYVVDAFDPRGVRVRLVVDPRSGDIVERLYIRNQRVIPAPEVEEGYAARGPRILNPSEEAAESQRREPRPPKRTARRPADRPAAERAPDIAAPVEQQPERPAEQSPPAAVAPEASRSRNRIPQQPKETPAQETVQGGAPPSGSATAATPSVPSAPGDPGTSGSGSVPGGERGTKANPRRVGPVVLPPAVGVE
ncbi:MAG: hypothetical protein K2P80_14635 [Beijerinckiaceae bacterium]|nr:hypothetical protein [Beijerinckiaceae bacterium]